MIEISAKTFAKNCVYNIIDKGKLLWLTNKDIGEKLGVENIYDLIDKEMKGRFETRNPTDEQTREYKRHGSELIDGEKFTCTPEDIIITIIMHCGGTKTTDSRADLGFNQHDLVMSKEQSVTTKIIKLFSNEKILLQHAVLSYRIDLYFPEHN